MPTLRRTLAQGAADSYFEGTIDTLLAGQTRRAYQIQLIRLELAQNFEPGASRNIEFALCRRSKAAMPNISDQDVIWKKALRSFFTTSGAGVIEGVYEFEPRIQTLIVEDYLYAEMDSNGTGLSNTAYLAIDYELVDISEIDRLTLLTQSLS